MSSLRQPSGRWPVSSPSIQEAMVSPAWSICARPPRLSAAPSPRSYASTLLNRICSPIRRRWAECAGFHALLHDAESVPLLRWHHSLTREPHHSALSTCLPLRPSNYQSEGRRRPAALSGHCSTRDGRERKQQPSVRLQRHDVHI